MVQIYLVDTCIWRDFYEDRFSESGRHLGRYATEFFMRVLKNKDKILFSNALVRELGIHYSNEEINNLFNLFYLSNALVHIPITKEDISEAEKLSKERNLPIVDCLNAIQARNHSACVVSQDRHYFEKLSDIAKVIRP